MEVKLSPELAAVIEQGLASGRYSSAEEYIAEAIDVLHEREQWFGETLQEQRDGLEHAWQQAERGEVLTLDEFQEDMRQMKAEWMAQRQSS
jgi:putative addiction module CopG family antidote